MWMLALTIFAFIIWMVTGFNLEEGDVPALGIQWSTFGTFTLFFYLLTINLQLGGLESFKQLRSEVRYDLGFLFHPLSRTRSQYRTNGVVDPLHGFTVALLVCVSCLFLFESIWVPLYDYFQFGSVMWPVYSASTSYFTVFDRNTNLLPSSAHRGASRPPFRDRWEGPGPLPPLRVEVQARPVLGSYTAVHRSRVGALDILPSAAVRRGIADNSAGLGGALEVVHFFGMLHLPLPGPLPPEHLHLLSVLGRGTALPAQRNLTRSSAPATGCTL